jgi:4'-phosphopantetheinyl transferase
VLRELISRYLGRDPQALRFITGGHGKPSLSDQLDEACGARSTVPSGDSFHFNLSHSGRVALYAFTNLGPVGVDVEVHGRRAVDSLPSASRLLDRSQAQRLEALGASARKREFRRVWTRREAELKCRGTGFSGRVDEWDSPLWVSDREVQGVGTVAIALSSEPGDVTCWAWTE